MKSIGAALLIAASLAQIASAEVAVTIYNQDLALVRESREFDYPKGTGEIRFIDVASQIIPTSVHFSSPKASLLEQNYEYDLVSSNKLLEKYTDRRVELLTQDDRRFEGTLLASAGDIVLKELDGGIRSITRGQIVNVRFPDLPEGLITRPTLVWLVRGDGGKGKADISYLTNGMSWEAEYVAVTDDKDENLSLTGWVNVTNNSGATFKEAKIKLMAGNVQVIASRDAGMYGKDRVMALAVAEAEDSFVEQAFYEYHLYTLQRPSTLADRQVKQLSLFPTAETPVKKEYRYSDYGKVKVTLEFQNREKVGLGIPLPKGKVRVYKEGPGGGLEFVGEDRIDHTPKDEKVRVSTGNAFDVVVEKTMTDSKDMGRSGRQETWVYKLRNHKKEAIDVIVETPLRWRGDWKLLEGTTPGWEKKSANRVEWVVSLKPDEEKELKYIVEYSN